MIAEEALRLQRLAERHAASVARDISQAAGAAHNEREFQTAATARLAQFAHLAGVEFVSREEYAVAAGFADAVHSRLIIEYEAPNSLRPDLQHGRTAHAVGQVKQYLVGVAQTDRHDIARLLGVAFDGRTLIFVRYREGAWQIDHPLQWNEDAAVRLLRAVVALTSGRALNAQNLVEDFQAATDLSRRALRALYDALSGHGNDLTGALYRQWGLFFSEASRLEENSARLRASGELRQFARAAGIDLDDLDVSRLLFATHTYFSFIAKAIAAHVIEATAGGGLGARPLGQIANLDSEEFRAELARVEDGGVFRALGFENLLEGDFFSWYLHAWTEELEQALRAALRRLSDYNPATTMDDPYSGRDLLKKLYHYLLPREVRHDLGEYYTPDWLATRVLAQLQDPLYVLPGAGTGPRIDFRRRLLDPACGSGTFLILAITSIKEHARREGLGELDTLEALLRGVVGIDLNPLAVLAARVGYLLAIADLVPFRRGPISIPVFLADSIVAPAEPTDLFRHGQRVLDTVVDQFALPREIDSAEAITDLTDTLHHAVENGFSADAFLARIDQLHSIAVTDANRGLYTDLFTRLAALHAADMNGVWARVIKNAFMPVFIGEFDYIAGNPPWVNWEYLPAAYRELTRPLWDHYQLRPSAVGTRRPRIGTARVDISTLMTYAVVDRHLRAAGKLAFVITQSVFKTGASAGFRRFRLPSGMWLRITAVDDMTEIQPFEGAANRTSVFVLQKDRRTTYPVVYTYWKRRGGRGRLTYDSSLAQVLEATSRRVYAAEPVDPEDTASIWLTAPRRLLVAVRRVLGASTYRAHAGVYSGGANAVFWVRVVAERPDGAAVVENITEGARRQVRQAQAPIERPLLYPLLRSRDIGRWNSAPSAWILMVWNPLTETFITENEMQRDYPHAYAYLNGFRAPLAQRRDQGTRRIIETGGPFFAFFSVAAYSFAPYKVVWGRIGRDIVASVVGRDVIPQETISFVGVATEDEAHYVAAVLNSVPFRFAAAAYSQVGGKSFAAPHLLEQVRVPTYDPANEMHRELTRLSRAAAAGVDDLGAIEGDVSRLAAQLWDLTEAELRELSATLPELQGMAAAADD